MAEVVEKWVTIDLRLRFVLFGLECAFDVSFDGAECERAFRDAAEDQVNAKRYSFFASRRLTVTGRVDDYEPETILLRVEGRRGRGAVFQEVVEKANGAAFRLSSSEGGGS